MWHGKVPEIHNDRSPELVPDKDEDGYLVFKDHPEFRPNLSPKEVESSSPRATFTLLE
jgi:hypothetical protein